MMDVRAASTPRQIHIGDEPYIALMAGVLRQAALDYKYAVEWLAKHPDDGESKKYKMFQKLKRDVVMFTKSDLFDFAVGGTIDPETFLKTALGTVIRQNRN